MLSNAARTRIANLAVIAAALLPLLFILPLANQPVTRDEGAYLTLGRGILHGQLPYRDLFDHKPPLIYGWYAASLVVFGDRPAAPRIAGALCLVVTVLATAACAGRLHGRGARAIAALVMGGMTSIAALQWGFNTETFMLPVMTGSLLAFLRATEKPKDGTAWAFVAGISGGLAALTKSVAVFNLLALVLFPLFSRGLVPERKCSVRYSMAMVAGAGAAGFMVCLPFVISGATRDFFYANVTYNRLYGGEIGLDERLSMSWRSLLLFIMAIGPFAFLALAGAGSSLRRRSNADQLILLWTAASGIGVIAAGHFFLHYYGQLVPGLALLAGSLAGVKVPLRTTVGRVLFAVLAVACCALFVRTSLVPVYFGTLESRVGLMETDELVAQRTVEGPAVGRYLADRMSGQDTLFNFGRETEIYYYAHATPAAPDLYDRRFWLDPSKFQQSLDALRASPPTYIVDTSTYGAIVFKRPEALVQLLRDEYVYETTVDFAAIYRLRGSVERPSIAELQK